VTSTVTPAGKAATLTAAAEDLNLARRSSSSPQAGEVPDRGDPRPAHWGQMSRSAKTRWFKFRHRDGN
jgi:hypothetical protein